MPGVLKLALWMNTGLLVWVVLVIRYWWGLIPSRQDIKALAIFLVYCLFFWPLPLFQEILKLLW